MDFFGGNGVFQLIIAYYILAPISILNNNKIRLVSSLYGTACTQYSLQKCELILIKETKNNENFE